MIITIFRVMADGSDDDIIARSCNSSNKEEVGLETAVTQVTLQ